MNPWIAKMMPVWRRQLAKAQLKPRRLRREPHDPEATILDREFCIICRRRTLYWLQPENAPLCKVGVCLKKYLKDPTVYDPRGLYGPPNTGKKAS